MLYHHLFIVHSELFMLINLSEDFSFPIQLADLGWFTNFWVNGFYMCDLSQDFPEITNFVVDDFVDGVAFLLLLINDCQGFSLHIKVICTMEYRYDLIFALVVISIELYNIMTENERAKRKPTELSDFQNLEIIGRGAFGKVYKALHKQAKKMFALKRISKKQIKAQNMITQLNNQIKISRQLEHKNIIKLYDTFDDGEDIYLVLQLAVNGQLYSKIYREGKLDERTAKRMIKQVIEAVSYLHSRNPPIIHRDIKPQNILLDKTNQVKLADFGWSNFLNKPRNTYCGTFDYLAPQMIDKSGHDQKLDIWCIGVLAYELMTGKTPFVVQGPKEQTKKIIQKNILDVNITFPNDFPILAKSFILGMVKRKPQERVTLKELMNHQWLINNQQRPEQLPIMHKKPPTEDPPVIDVKNNIVEALNKRVRQLEEEVNSLKVNEKALAQGPKGLADNPEYISLMKELRKLRGVQQKNIQLQTDNQKYWQQIAKKDKEIIKLKGQIKVLEDNQESIDKLKNDKKALQQKIKKLQKDLENSQIKNAQLNTQLAGISDSLGGRLSRGQKITLSEAQTAEYLQLIQKQINILEQKFNESQKALQAVLAKEKFSKQKQNELSQLRAQQKSFRQFTKAELKQQFQQQKDRILVEARTELTEERQKWLKERAELKQLFEQQANQNSSRQAYNNHQDLELQAKTLRQLQSYQQATINQLKQRIRQLQSQQDRRKK